MGDSSEAKRVRHAASGRIMVPNTGIELPLNLDLSRRDILKIAGYGSLAAFIAACGGGSPGSSGSANVTAKGGSVSIGSNASDPGVKKGLADIVSAFTSANESIRSTTARSRTRSPPTWAGRQKTSSPGSLDTACAFSRPRDSSRLSMTYGAR